MTTLNMEDEVLSDHYDDSTQLEDLEDDLENYDTFRSFITQQEDLEDDFYIRIEPIKILNYSYYNSVELYHSELKKTIQLKFPDLSIQQRNVLFENLKELDLEHRSLNMLMVAILLCTDVKLDNAILSDENYDYYFSKYQFYLAQETNASVNKETILLQYRSVLLNYIIYVVDTIKSLNPFE